MRSLLPCLVIALAGCPAVTGKQYDENVRDLDGDGAISDRFGGPDCRDDDPSITACDADGDGERSVAAGGLDCDDTDATVNPSAVERCNGVDDDCNDAIDNQDPGVQGEVTWWLDRDGDGAGDPDSGLVCQEYADPSNPSTGIHAPDPDDCDDDDAAIGPHADEICDGLDNDCDGITDDAGVWLLDTDGDGFGLDGSQAVGPCTLGPDDGVASVGGDCDDLDASISPDATEVPYDGVDGNCNGGLDDWDADFDGYVPSEHWAQAQAANALLPVAERWDLQQGDCDDDDPRANAGAAEVCDGVDNDCDGSIDVADLANAAPTDELALRAQVGTWFLDADGDGSFGTEVLLCPDQVDAALHSASADDCYDGGPAPAGFENADPAQVYSGNTESCDGFDNDCDGLVDFGTVSFPGSQPLWLDADGDGFGSQARFGCATDATLGLVDQGEDCNDAAANVFPGAPEICGDAVRQDCSTADIFDCDGDGSQGSYVGGGDGSDCDDERSTVNPDVTVEICDGIDNDCDGFVDSADPDNLDAGNEPFWYLDADGDGYGIDDGSPIQQCDQPAGRALNADDCDDADDALSPETIWYADLDGDGYGGTTTWEQCAPPLGVTTVLVGGDCNDADAVRHPDAIWSVDADQDGYGASGTEDTFCEPPTGESWAPGPGTDCDDSTSLRSPGLPEINGDGVDNDCDGVVDGGAQVTWYIDADGDGFGDAADPGTTAWAPGLVPNDSDCDDSAAAVNPSAQVELCDGIDNNCDGLSIFGNPDVSNPWDGVIIPDDALSWYLAATDTGHFSLGLLLSTCVPAGQLTLTTPDGIRSLLPLDQVEDPTPYLTCPDGVTQGELWGFDSDGDGVPGADDPRQLALVCDGTPPASFTQVIDAIDCAPDDPSRAYNVEPGTYGDVDGDGSFAPWTDTDACAADLSIIPGTDCNDYDANTGGPSADGTVLVPFGVPLDEVVAACDHARLQLQVSDQLSGDLLALKPQDAHLEIFAEEQLGLLFNAPSSGGFSMDLTLENLEITGFAVQTQINGAVELRDSQVTDLRLIVGTGGDLLVENSRWTGSIGPHILLTEPTAEALVVDTLIEGAGLAVLTDGHLEVERSTINNVDNAIIVQESASVMLKDVVFIDVQRPLFLSATQGGGPTVDLEGVVFEESVSIPAPVIDVAAGNLTCTDCTAWLPTSNGPLFKAHSGGELTLDGLDVHIAGDGTAAIIELDSGDIAIRNALIDADQGPVIRNTGAELELRDSVVKAQVFGPPTLTAEGSPVSTLLDGVEVRGAPSSPAIQLFAGAASLRDVVIDGGNIGIEIDIGGALIPIDELEIRNITQTGLLIRSSSVTLDDLSWRSPTNSGVTAVWIDQAADVTLRGARFFQTPQHGLNILNDARMTVVDSEIRTTGTPLNLEGNGLGATLALYDSRVFSLGGEPSLVATDALIEVQRSLLHAPLDANQPTVQLLDTSAVLDRVSISGNAGEPLLRVEVSTSDSVVYGDQLLFWPAPDQVGSIESIECLGNYDVQIWDSVFADGFPGCGVSIGFGPNWFSDFGVDSELDPTSLLATDPVVRAHFGEVAIAVPYTPPGG